MHGASRDAKEVLAVGLGEAAVTLGYVGGDGEGGSVELTDQETVSPREFLGGLADFVGEVECLLVDEKLLEGERHAASQESE